MEYAFDEFLSLVSRLPSPIPDGDPVVRYICALISELAYHHVPTFEIDNKKRAKLIPCEANAEIVRGGTSTNVMQYIQSMDFPRSFVVVDRGVIAVGIPINDLLFIGFRGTTFLYDWRVNFRASLVDLNGGFRFDGPFVRRFSGWGGGRVHRGFAEEAVRISARIMDAMREQKIDNVDHIFLTGHSLGGAVAALAENFFPRGSISTCIFGAPRYCNVSAYYSSPVGPPTQIQRVGDIVPMVPPKGMGYADHPYQFDTRGTQIIGPINSSRYRHFIWLSALFFGKRFEPHSMESYRRELGNTANVPSANAPLAPFEKLRVADTQTQVA